MEAKIIQTGSQSS